MIPENFSPLLAYKAAPPDDDTAAAKLCDFASEGLFGIVGIKFRNLNQFLGALRQCGWDVRTMAVAATSPMAKTYGLVVRDREGKDWRVFATVYGHGDGSILEVTNVGENADKAEEE